MNLYRATVELLTSGKWAQTPLCETICAYKKISQQVRCDRKQTSLLVSSSLGGFAQVPAALGLFWTQHEREENKVIGMFQKNNN